MVFLPVSARAILTAYIVASVPVETYRIFSATGTAFCIISENETVISFTVPCIQQDCNCFLTTLATCGAACPIIGILVAIDIYKMLALCRFCNKRIRIKKSNIMTYAVYMKLF